MVTIYIPESAEIAIKLLENNGFKAFLVGGSVRDYLIQSQNYSPEANDIDIATNARPEQIKSVFQNFTVFETGIKYGTVTVNILNRPVELTSFRTESGYEDSRHPDKIFFTDSLYQDLSRRDFTINAIAFNPSSGFEDPFGGKKDIQKGIIKCVGNPHEKFSQDPLRIMRALRFFSCLKLPSGSCFEIEENTKSEMFNCKEKLTNISAERVSDELIKTLKGGNAKQSFLCFFDIVCIILPELRPLYKFEQNNKYHIYDVLEHTLTAVENIKNDGILKLAALLHDIAKPYCYTEDSRKIGHFYGHAERGVEISDKILTRLKLDNKNKQRILTIIKYHDVNFLPDERQLTRISDSPDATKYIKNWMSKLGYSRFCDLIHMKKADNSAKHPSCLMRLDVLNSILDIAECEAFSDDKCFCVNHLNITGNDIKRLGISEGPEIGRILNSLLTLTINGEVKNNKNDLIGYIKGHFLHQ